MAIILAKKIFLLSRHESNNAPWPALLAHQGCPSLTSSFEHFLTGSTSAQPPPTPHRHSSVFMSSARPPAVRAEKRAHPHVWSLGSLSPPGRAPHQNPPLIDRFAFDLAYIGLPAAILSEARGPARLSPSLRRAGGMSRKDDV